MTKEERKEEQHRLKCEKMVNELWSIAEEHYDQIQAILEEKDLIDSDIVLLKLAANAFVAKAKLDRLNSEYLFEVDPNK